MYRTSYVAWSGMMHSNCGGDFVIRNNLFIECQQAVHQGGNNLTGSRAAALYSSLEKFPFRSALWQSHYPALAKWKDWTVPEQPPAGSLDGPLNNSLATNIIVNFSAPFYWGECECCENGEGFFSLCSSVLSFVA